MTPKIFIGSSNESIEWAYAAQRIFADNNLYADVWKQSAFPLSEYPLASLLNDVKKYDFGVFICSFDDELTKRGVTRKFVRDNILFELGIFWGYLGIERNFILIPDNIHEYHFPSDLHNLTYATYQADSPDKLTGITAACTRIISQIHSVIPTTLPSNIINKFIFSSEIKSPIVISHCSDSDIYARSGIAAPGGTLIGILSQRGVTNPELRTISDSESNDDLTTFVGANTIFVIDSPSVNHYSKKILENYKIYLSGGSISHKSETSGPFRIQKILANGKSYESDKHDKTTKEKVFGNFTDYLVVIRLPGYIIDGDQESENDRLIWLIYGITIKGSHVGANLFSEKSINNMEVFLSTHLNKSISDLKYFEAVFKISDKKERIDDYNSNDITLVHFAELRSKRECFAGEPPPSGIEKLFNNKSEWGNIPIYSVHLDPVAACNYHCPKCIEDHVREKKMCLSIKSICQILTDLRKQGCKFLHFYGGEPTLHPEFNLIVNLASSMGYQMMLVTNGSQLYNTLIFQSLKDAQNMHVRVSLDAHSQEIYDRRHGLAAQYVDLDVLKNSIVELIHDGVSVSISYLLDKDSISELTDACWYWKEKGATSFNPRITMARNGILKKRISSTITEENRKLFKDILNEYKSFVVIPDWFRSWINSGEEPISEKQFNRCYSGYYRIGISPYCSPGNEQSLSKVNVPSLKNGKEELRVTDEAWISNCLYHRYDVKFGSIYPKNLAQWCKIDRLEKLNSIKPDQRGICDQTICSRSEGNQRLSSSLLIPTNILINQNRIKKESI